MSRASSADFLDSFIENISETKSSSHSLSTKSSRKSINNSLSRKSSQKLTLDRPVLPSLGPVNSSSRQSFRSGSSHEDDGEGLKPDLEVNWKRASKLATKFEIPNMTLTQEYVESDEESDIESDEESKIRQMAQRATLKRRPTIALALMSSSEESEDENNEWTTRDSNAEQLAASILDKKDELLGDDQNQDYLAIMRRATRKISTIKQLQQEFPDMVVEEQGEEEKKEQTAGLRKFRKIGTSVKMVTKLTSTATTHSDQPTVEPTRGIRGNQTTTRRAALASHDSENDSYQIKRNVEKIINEKTHRFVLHPHSSFRFYWDLVSIIILLANLVTIPLELSFYLADSDNTTMTLIKFVTDIWFILDMMLNFRTGIFTYSIRKVLEMDPTEIRKNYVKSWFLLDLLATFPFDVFVALTIDPNQSESFVKKAKYLKMGRILKILTLLRILRLGRFVRYLHQWEEQLNMSYGFAENVVKCLSWTFILLMVGHWNACILYLIPDQSLTDLSKGLSDGYGPQQSLDQSWIHLYDLDSTGRSNVPWLSRYFKSYFKSLSHMLSIGYGCFTPNNEPDMWATILVLFVGCVVFALFLSQMISLIDQINMSEKIFKRHLQEVDDYLRFNRTTQSLKRSIKDFYEYHYKQRIFDEEEILSELNPLLHEEVVTCGLINYIKDCDFFRTCRDDLQRKLCHLFNTEMYQPGTEIVNKGNIARSFYIIRQGVVVCTSEEGRRNNDYFHLGEGDYFGLECFASMINPRAVSTITTESWVEVIQLDIRDLNTFMQKSTEYNDEIKLILALANETLKRNGDFLRIVAQQREAKLYYG